MSDGWEAEVLSRIAEQTGGVVERGEKVRIGRGQTVAEAFVLLRRQEQGAHLPSEILVLLRVPVGGSAAQDGPFRGASPPRRQVRGRPRIALGAEEFLDTAMETVSPDRAVQTGNPRLDNKVYFESDSPDEEVREVLGDPVLQNRIADLIERRCDSLYINEGGKWLCARFTLRLDPDETERLREITEAFFALSDALPAFVGPAAKPSSLPKLERRLMLLVAVVGFATMVGGTSWRPTIDPSPFAWGGVGLALWTVYLVGLWIVLRRRSRVRRIPATRARRMLVVRGVLAFVGLPGICLGSALIINGVDSGPLQRHTVDVLSKDSRKEKYYLVVTEFRPAQNGSLKVRAAYDLWERTGPGQKVVLVVGPGRLGWPWLSHVE